MSLLDKVQQRQSKLSDHPRTSFTKNLQEESEQNVVDVSNYTLDNIPFYSGPPYVEANINELQFREKIKRVLVLRDIVLLIDWDGPVSHFALVDIETMSTEERGSIGEAKPTGWHTVCYNGVAGGN